MGKTFHESQAEMMVEVEKKVMAKPRLTGLDYIMVPISILVKHKDFSQHAYRVIMKINEMTTTQIEQIQLTPNGRAS